MSLINKTDGARIGTHLMPPDALETVVHTAKATNTQTTYNNVRRKPKKKFIDRSSGSELSVQTVTFQFYAISPSPEFQQLDTLTDANGVVYQVMEVDKKLMGSVYDVTTTQNVS